LHETFGAEIWGIDLTRPLDAEQRGELIQAFYDYQVLVFRGQSLTPAQHIELSKHFGTPDIHPLDQYLHPDHQEILIISNVIGDNGQTEGLDEDGVIEWHSDFAWHRRPSIGSVLHGVVIPPIGGDTLFASMYTAYETLAAEMRERLSGLMSVRSLDFLTENERKLNPLKPPLTNEQRAKTPPVVYPLLRQHPVTGRTSLFIGEMVISEIPGMDQEEAEALLHYLIAHSTRPDLVYRHRWQHGDLVAWDNRCTLHTATPCDRRYPRVLHRTTLEGEPVLQAEAIVGSRGAARLGRPPPEVTTKGVATSSETKRQT
jgi:taurine dioxygenase